MTGSAQYDIQWLRHVFPEAMQAAGTGAKAFRLDNLLNTRKVGGKRATISRSRSWLRLTRRAVGLVLSVDGGNGRYQVFECKIELLRISLLGFAAEGGVFGSDDQLLQPLDPLMLWDFTLLRRDQHRLQGRRPTAFNIQKVYQI